MTMRTCLKLNPGKRGTKKLLAKYDDKLVCVHYRYDEQTNKRYKAVELIEDVIDGEPKLKPRLAWNENTFGRGSGST